MTGSPRPRRRRTATPWSSPCPFRFRFPDESSPETLSRSGPRFQVAEVGLYLRGFEETYRPLRRGLVATSSSPRSGFWPRWWSRTFAFPATSAARKWINRCPSPGACSSSSCPGTAGDWGPLELLRDLYPGVRGRRRFLRRVSPRRGPSGDASWATFPARGFLPRSS